MAGRQKFLSLLLRLFTSLQLTIVCLVLGMIIIFWGTWEQQRLGIDQAVATYFRSFVVWFSPSGASWRIPIFPGGFLVGSVLLLNLVCAHVYRFRLSARKAGIWMAHLGLIILLLGELLTALFSVESQIRLSEGETKSYSESIRETELAIIDRSDPKTDKVVTITESGIKAGKNYQQGGLPFRIEVRAFFANSEIFRRTAETAAHAHEGPQATQGVGLQYDVHEVPRTGRPDERDLTSAWIELIGTEGSLGTWMVSNAFREPQTLTHAGKTYTLDLRQRRYYKPYSIKLLDFTHDRYPGTEIPKNFSSRVRLVDQRRNEDREVLIYMNHPLRYDGLTFYQSGFEGEQTTVLQVVRNQSRHLPYISCVLVFLGLCYQFGMHLIGFFRRRKALAAAAAA